MRFMVMLKMRADAGPPPDALGSAVGSSMGELFGKGVMLDAGGLDPSVRTEVRLNGGQMSVTDGAAGSGEIVAAYSIVEVGSHAEATEIARQFIELHKQHWPGWEGAAEVSQIAGPQGPDPASRESS